MNFIAASVIRISSGYTIDFAKAKISNKYLDKITLVYTTKYSVISASPRKIIAIVFFNCLAKGLGLFFIAKFPILLEIGD